MDLVRQAYDKISDNYKRIELNNKETLSNIKKVESIYNIYVNSEQIDSVNYSIYIDDIKHQADITQIEYKYLYNINNVNEIKLYRDLFKLYGKIIKVLLNIYIDNKIMIIKIWNSNIIYPNETENFKKAKSVIKNLSEKNMHNSGNMYDDKSIFDIIKKYYYSLIKVHNEIEEINTVDLDDIDKLFNEIYKRMEELILSTEFININLIDIKDKTKKGITGHSYMMDLVGKIKKIKTEYSNLVKLANSILHIHRKLSDKYLILSVQTLQDITYDERTIKSNKDINNREMSIRNIDIISLISSNMNRSRIGSENSNVSNVSNVNNANNANNASNASNITETIFKLNEIQNNNLDINVEQHINEINIDNVNNIVFEDDI